MTDIDSSSDVHLRNDTFVLHANITVRGSGSLYIINSTILMGPGANGSVRLIQALGDASMFMEASTVLSESGRAMFQLRADTTGCLRISDSILDGGRTRKDGPYMPCVYAKNASIIVANTTFMRAAGGIKMEYLAGAVILDTNLQVGPIDAIGLRRCVRTRIEGCILSGNLKGTGVNVSACNGVEVVDCDFTDNNYGMFLATQTSGVEIHGSRFKGHSTAGVFIFDHARAPGLIIDSCEFQEDLTAIRSTYWPMSVGHWSAENVTIINCSFRFTLYGAYLTGDGWSVVACTFDHCSIGIRAESGEAFRIEGNVFHGTISTSIEIVFSEGDPPQAPSILGNRFDGGSASGIASGTPGDVLISANSFERLRGTCIGVSNSRKLIIRDNDISDSWLAYTLTNVIGTVSNETVRDCPAGIIAMDSEVLIEGCLLEACRTPIRSERSQLTLTSGSVIGGGDILLDESMVGIQREFEMAGTSATCSNRSRVSAYETRTVPLCNWSLETGATLDLFNLSPPERLSVSDPASSWSLWWAVDVMVVRMSDGGPIPGVHVGVFNVSLGMVADLATGTDGTTHNFWVKERTVYTTRTVHFGPYRIIVTHLDRDTIVDRLLDASESIVVTVDDVPPLIRIYSPSNDAVLGIDWVSVEGTVEDTSPIDGLTLTVDGGTPMILASNGTWNAHIRLDDGRHRIQASAVDLYGNEGSDQVVIVIDLYPAFLEVWTPSDGDVLVDHDVIVTGMTEPLLDVRCLPSSCMSDANGLFTLLVRLDTEGRQLVTVDVMDDLGRRTTTNIQILVDWTPPSLALEEEGRILNSTRPSLTILASEPLSYLEIDGSRVELVQGNELPIRPILIEGRNTVTWTCIDLSGINATGAFDVIVDTTVNLTVRKPVQGDRVIYGWVVLSGSTDPDASLEELRTGMTVLPSPDGSFTFSVWTGDVGNGLVRIRARDPNGNSMLVVVEYEVLPPPQPPGGGRSWYAVVIILLGMVILIPLIMFSMHRKWRTS